MFKAEYIFVRILFPLIAGIEVFYFFPTEKNIWILAVVSTTILLSALTINLTYRKFNAYKFKGFTGILLFVFFFTFGGLICLLKNEKLQIDYFANGEFRYLKVWVNDEPEQTNDILRFKSRVISGYNDQKQIKQSGQLLLALKVDSLNPVQLKYGDELIISAKHLEVEPPYNPAEFDLKDG